MVRIVFLNDNMRFNYYKVVLFSLKTLITKTFTIIIIQVESVKYDEL